MPRTGVAYLEPRGYLDFVALLSRARLVLTDSGRIQEESTALGVPCLTVGGATERPATVSHGTNTLVGKDPRRIVGHALGILATPPPRKPRPPLWDGAAAGRIVSVLAATPQGGTRHVRHA